MGFYERLEKKLSESKDSTKEEHKKILKLADLQRKAKYNEEYISLYEKYNRRKRKIGKRISTIQDKIHEVKRVKLDLERVKNELSLNRDLSREVDISLRDWKTQAKADIDWRFNNTKENLYNMEKVFMAWVDAINLAQQIKYNAPHHNREKKIEELALKSIGDIRYPYNWLRYLKSQMKHGTEYFCKNKIIEGLSQFQKQMKRYIRPPEEIEFNPPSLDGAKRANERILEYYSRATTSIKQLR